MLIEVDILWILKYTLYAIMQFMFMSFVFKLFFCYGRTKKENILIVVLLWSGMGLGWELHSSLFVVDAFFFQQAQQRFFFFLLGWLQ